jgi:hypothetical protein
MQYSPFFTIFVVVIDLYEHLSPLVGRSKLTHDIMHVYVRHYNVFKCADHPSKGFQQTDGNNFKKGSSS